MIGRMMRPDLKAGCEMLLRRQKKQRDSLTHSPSEWLIGISSTTRSTFRPAFIFAHPDDVSFSAFSALRAAGSRALDIVVCGGQPEAMKLGAWDRQCGFFSSHDARVRRLAEHDSVIRMIGSDSVILDVIDDQCGGSNAETWHQAQQHAIAQLRSARCNLVITHSWNAQHVDHSRVVTLAVDAARQLQIPAVFSCDRPYFYCSSDRCGFPATKTEGTIRRFLLSTDVWDLKLAAIKSYASQHLAMSAAFGLKWHEDIGLRTECYSTAVCGGRRM
jgi:LmbE family N-acetylglucosaminyl deacetylase